MPWYQKLKPRSTALWKKRVLNLLSFRNGLRTPVVPVLKQDWTIHLYGDNKQIVNQVTKTETYVRFQLYVGLL